MATTIDTKVVEMKFDNKDFEKNTKQTMSTLEKLKAKLHFKGATDGLEKVSQAARNVKMDGLATGIETVNARFSAMDIIATTALVNITNSAIEAGKRLVASISTDQITAGWSKMEQQMSSMQTLMNSTGKDIEEIEGYLDELMWYSDETSYGFTDMTAALANMTATGGKIEKLVPMIMGIANATAYAGKGAAEFSRVIYNLNQSYGGGYLTLMDWKSVQLAGANSKQLTESLIRWGEELGTIKKGQVTIGNFNDSLKDRWVTTKVMEKSFGEFADFTLKVKEAIDAGEYSTASQAIKALSKDYVGISATAFKAAQEAKSFSEAVDATKDAVSSGWMRVFKTIFGNYEEQKELWTDLANALWDIFAEPIDKLESFLSKALGFDMIKNMWDKINNSPLLSAIKEVDGAIKKSSRTLEEYQKIVRKVWRGDFKNRGDNPDRFDSLEKAGWNPHVVQNLVNRTDQMAGKGKGWTVIDKLTIEDVIAAEQKYGITVDKSTMSVKEQEKALDRLTDKMLEDMGLNEEQIDLYHDLVAASKKWGISIDKIVAKMEKTDGRTHLEKSWREIGNIVKETISAIGIAFGEVFHFNPINLYLSLEKLHEKLTSIRKLLIGNYIDELDKNGKKTGNKILQRSKHYQNLIDTLKGLLSVLKLIKIIVGGGMKIVFTVVSTVLKAFGLTILDVTAAVGNIVTALVDWIEENEFIIKGIQWLVSAIMKGLNWVWEWADSHFSVASAVRTLLSVLKSGKNSIKTWIEGLMQADDVGKYLLETFGKLPNKISELWNKFKETRIGQIILGWWKALKNSDFGKAIGKWIDRIKGTKFIQKIKAYFDSFDGGSVGKNIILGIYNGVKTYGKIAIDGIKNFGLWLLEGIKKVLGIHSPSVEFFEIGKNIVLGLFNGIKSIIMMVYTLLTTIGGKLIEIIKDLDVGSIFVALLSAGAIVGLLKLAQAMNILANGLQNVNQVIANFADLEKAFAGFLKAAKVKVLTSALKDVAISVAILVGSIWLLCKLNVGQVWASIGAIAALIVLMGLLVTVAGKFGGSTLQFGKLALTVLAIGIAIGLMAKALKKISEIKNTSIGSIVVLGIIIGALIGVLALISRSKSFDAKKISGLLLSIGLMFYLMGETVKKLGQLTIDEIGQGIAALAGFTILISALMVTTKAIGGKAKSIQSIGKTLVLIGVTFYLMGMTVKKLGRLNKDQVTQGTSVLNAFCKMIIALMVSTRLLGKNSKNIQSIGKTLMNIGTAILLMGITCKMLGNMPLGKLVKGIVAVGIFEGMIIGLIASMKKIGSTDCKNLGITLMGIAMAIGIMSLSCALLSLMKTESLVKGILAVGLLSKFMKGLIEATNGSHIISAKTMWAMVAAIAVMALAVGLLSIIDPQRLIAPTIAIGLLMGIFSLMIKEAKNLNGGKSLTTNLYIMLGILGAMGLIVALLALIVGPDKALKSAASIALITVGLIGVMYALNKLPETNIKKLKSQIVGMIAIIAVLFLAVSVLKKLNGIENVGTGVMALGILVSGLAGLLYLLSKMNVSLKDAVKGAAGLAILMASLLIGVQVLKQMNGIENVTGAALGLVILVSGLTLVMFALSKMGGLSAKALLGVVGIAALMATLLIAVQVLKQMSGVDNAAQSAIILTAFIGALTILLLLTAAVGAIYMATAGVAATGLLGLLAMIGLVALIIPILKAMNSAKNAETNCNLLISLITVMTEMLFKISLVGPLALMAVTALGALMVMMPILIAFAVALGALFETIPQLQGFLNTGLPIMIQVAGAIGEMIGAFVSGILTELSGALPVIGKNLSLFALNAVPFIATMKLVNGNVAKGTAILAAAIIGLTVADLLNAITSFFTGGFDRLGTELTKFALNALPFMIIMSSIPASAMNGVKSLAQAVLCLTAANLLDGLARFFGGGDASLEAFGKELPPLGTSLAEFITNLGTFSDAQVKATDCAGQAIEALANAANKIPRTGGLWQGIFGESGLAKFAETMPDVGTGCAKFVENLGTFGDPQIKTSNAACEVIKALTVAAKGVGKDGGFWQGLFGSKNDGLAKFAKNMPDVGKGVKGFIEELDKVKNKAEVAKAGANIIESVANLGKIDLKKANENMPKFMDKMGTYGSKVKDFIVEFKDLTEDDVKSSSSKLSLITEAVQNMIKIINQEFTDNSDKITTTVQSIAEKAAKAFDSDKVTNEIAKQGKNFVAGFAKGIKENENLATSAAEQVAQNALDASKKKLNEHSPSKETQKQGEYFGEGFVIGIESYSSRIYKVSESVGESAKTGLASAIAKISNLVESGIDANPTIRPVLDLSNIEAGANTIGSMFNNPSMQVEANLNSISSGMKTRSQNGNSDVISAIDKLGRNIESSGGNTYNLGNISYNDDSAIGIAVQELVRAIEVERRV